jgi:hypothetical protein
MQAEVKPLGFVSGGSFIRGSQWYCFPASTMLHFDCPMSDRLLNPMAPVAGPEDGVLPIPNIRFRVPHLSWQPVLGHFLDTFGVRI